ncbi:purine-cytosine permease family protein [Paenisporosarcina cavernae]|uniref:Cytosine permease n=1 Tax=Paenisporosarcina cavernae TaxID=2320858 RepID=A0A385YT36_9BACL|nr:cytosine permease [Paenisporosarcina cavernae]AYC29846.1 cytosine permease [Paenisporosarcina cavernae]
MRSSSVQLEKLGLEAVTSDLKTSSWSNYAIIQFAFSVNAGNLLIPALAVLEGHMTWPIAFLSVLSGALLAFLFVSLMSHPGAVYGFPAQYVIRSLIGQWLTRKIASPVRTITSLYWFGVQTIGGAYIIQQAATMYDVTIPFVPVGLVLATIMAILALIGYDAIKKVTRTLFPLLILSQIVMIYLLVNRISEMDVSPSSSFSFGHFLMFSSLAFVQYVSGVSASSDMTRYAKTPKHGAFGMYIGNAIGYVIVAFIGTLSAAIFQTTNVYAALGNELSRLPGLLLLFSGILAMISINVGNAYTGGYSLLNTFSKLTRIQSAMIFGLAGIVISCFPQFSEYASTYIGYIGAGVVPLSAIIVVDYVWILQMKISTLRWEEVFRGGFQWNGHAFWCFFFGTILYLLIPNEAAPGFISFSLTGIVYFLLHRRNARIV